MAIISKLIWPFLNILGRNLNMFNWYGGDTGYTLQQGKMSVSAVHGNRTTRDSIIINKT